MLLLAVAYSQPGPTPPLTFVEFHQEGEEERPYGLEGLGSVLVSPDGRHVYTAAALDSTVVWFSRDLTTGALTFLGGALKDGKGGVDGLDVVAAVTLSPDGRSVYTAASGDHAVAVLGVSE
jgi:6-phosphogluconolactonase (cycloisomerase 2 family)